MCWWTLIEYKPVKQWHLENNHFVSESKDNCFQKSGIFYPDSAKYYNEDSDIDLDKLAPTSNISLSVGIDVYLIYQSIMQYYKYELWPTYTVL